MSNYDAFIDEMRAAVAEMQTAAKTNNAEMMDKAEAAYAQAKSAADAAEKRFDDSHFMLPPIILVMKNGDKTVEKRTLEPCILSPFISFHRYVTPPSRVAMNEKPGMLLGGALSSALLLPTSETTARQVDRASVGRPANHLGISFELLFSFVGLITPQSQTKQEF